MAEEFVDASALRVQEESLEDNDFQDALEGDESDYVSDDSDSSLNRENEGTEEVCYHWNFSTQNFLQVTFQLGTKN